MPVRQTRDRRLLAECIKNYLTAYTGNLSGNYEAIVIEASKLLGSKDYGLLITEDNKGFLFYSIGFSLFLGRHAAIQQFFYTANTGVRAARDVWELHTALVEAAKTNRCGAAISGGSNMDADARFAKLLERKGWLRDGTLAVFYCDK